MATIRKRRLIVLSPALLMLAGCGGEAPRTVYVAEPEVVAVFAGQARGADYSLARACGADARAVRARAADEPAPATLPAGAATIYKAALTARAGETMDRPDAAACAALRGRFDMAGLFAGGGRQAVAAERTVVTRGAYCAEGSEAVRRDPAMSAGLVAIRSSCRAGDTIAVPSDAVGIIASVCDLSKPTSSAGASVICTIGRVRRIRAGG